MKSWLHNNDVEIHSTHIERKFALTERFIKTLKNEVYKHMTAESENVNIDKLYTAVDNYLYIPCLLLIIAKIW